MQGFLLFLCTEDLTAAACCQCTLLIWWSWRCRKSVKFWTKLCSFNHYLVLKHKDSECYATRRNPSITFYCLEKSLLVELLWTYVCYILNKILLSEIHSSSVLWQSVIYWFVKDIFPYDNLVIQYSHSSCGFNSRSGTMVFCYQNCSDLLWEKLY